MSKVNYWEKKDEEIKTLVEERGLDIDLENYQRKDAIEALQVDDVKTGRGTEVLVQDEDGVKKLDPMKDLVKVRFHNTRDNEAPYIFLGHNGKSYLVPREEDILIPRFLLDSVVKDAVEIHSEMKKRSDGKITYIPKKVQRFPYTIVQ